MCLKNYINRCQDHIDTHSRENFDHPFNIRLRSSTRYFGRGVQSGKLCSDLMELTWKTYIRKIETKAMALSLARVQRATCANETAEKWPENGPTDSPVVNPDCKRAFIIRRPGEGEGEREVHNGEPRGRLVSAAF